MADDVVARQFDLRKGHLCTFPFNGLLVTAQGNIALCCASPHVPIKHLKDVPDLTDFYNGSEMEHVRTEMEEGRITSLESCSWCSKRYSEGHWTMMHVANDLWRHILTRNFDADWELRKLGKPRPVRFLEYTCSNTCNQICSTCNSYFSSKWRDIEEQFSVEEKKLFNRQVHERQSLSDEDIGKIFKILPNLSQLVVKGGEPWADKNNIEILSYALDCNPGCYFLIVSNMQSISASTFKMLEKVKANGAMQFNVLASIDGIGKVYDWVRGGSFDKTVRNMELFYQITGRKIQLIPFPSIHNYFHLEAIPEYFMDKEYVSGISISNVASTPAYIRMQNLPKVILARRQEELKRILPQYEEKMKKSGKFLYYDPLFNDIPLTDKFSSKALKLSMQWIEKVNEIRGFRLQDHVSELQEITEMVL